MSKTKTKEQERVWIRTEKENTGVQLTSRQYNMLIAGLLAYGFALSAVFCFIFAPSAASINPIALSIGYLVCGFIGICMGCGAERTLTRFIGFNLLIIPTGITLASWIPSYSNVVFQAALGTALIAGVMLIAAVIRPQIFEGLGHTLFVCLTAVIVVELLLILFFGTSSAFIDLAVIIIMAGFIGYDFIEANKAPRTLNNAISFSMDLYLDLINIFVRLVSIFGNED